MMSMSWQWKLSLKRNRTVPTRQLSCLFIKYLLILLDIIYVCYCYSCVYGIEFDFHLSVYLLEGEENMSSLLSSPGLVYMAILN